ncbi:PIN domain-containing protein [Mesorhizobium sp. CGMCC 1.15528]|uniref:PIN domain-containing protein n=1 Tax=Mesorhizobium zhangyense TaxID=1776730 RepID=A0A7C9VBS8_9HYPH|nr:PIN domain-containing protein [Mesorhizobium zhangyense]NGN41352.1 PIN domain-containing protein [Mesorhizobium zhangyense]
MPGAKVFIDSNTFLYTFDVYEGEKRPVAQHWLEYLSNRNCGVTNLQVLNEIANVAIRKSAKFGDTNVFFRIDAFADFGSHPLRLETTIAARAIHLTSRYSWWDCLLLASALELGCKYFLSEDLQDGQVIEGLTIIDPFAHSPEQIFASR